MCSQLFAAIILAGGAGTRIGHRQKASLELDGRTLLTHALAAVAGASQIVVVGDPTKTAAPVQFIRETPPYGGPAAALLAGLANLPPAIITVVVLAVDMPRVTSGTVQRLLKAQPGHDGAALVDADGRRQIAMAVNAVRLRSVTELSWPSGSHPGHSSAHGLSLSRLLAPLDLRSVETVGDESRDIDTWTDLSDLQS
jgi:molybdopterin-guanine dinucleotide biosynthesis protein A